jgi:hypothetical protein
MLWRAMGAKRFKGRRRPKITGVSLPVGGIQWEWTPSEREVLRHLIINLEGRRVLRSKHNHETKALVEISIQAMRGELTEALKGLPEASKAAPAIYAMREACEEFLTWNEKRSERPGRQRLQVPREWSEALDQLRIVFVRTLSELVDDYNLEVHGSLNTFMQTKRHSLRYVR